MAGFHGILWFRVWIKIYKVSIYWILWWFYSWNAVPNYSFLGCVRSGSSNSIQVSKFCKYRAIDMVGAITLLSKFGPGGISVSLTNWRSCIGGSSSGMQLVWCGSWCWFGWVGCWSFSSEGCWIVRNQWGSSWGLMVCLDVNEDDCNCGVYSRVVCGLCDHSMKNGPGDCNSGQCSDWSCASLSLWPEEKGWVAWIFQWASDSDGIG